MPRIKAYASPDDWLEDAGIWQRQVIDKLIAAITQAEDFELAIRYGNLFFFHHGQCIVIRHEEERVILGFFRGKRLLATQPRLKPGGKYELANIVLTQQSCDVPENLTELALQAARLNEQLGDPHNRSNY